MRAVSGCRLSVDGVTTLGYLRHLGVLPAAALKTSCGDVRTPWGRFSVCS